VECHALSCRRVGPLNAERGSLLIDFLSYFTAFSSTNLLTSPSCTSLRLDLQILSDEPESGGIDMSKPMTKSELISQIAEHSELKRSDVKGVMETLATIGYKELKKNGSFLVPGFAKFVVIKKPATKERSGINPFTKEPTVFKARPARKIIRARPVKAAKDAV
jgi:DNA-binding protein HU-beta